ncbi:MAG: hypothetical protein IH627_18760 [Rubrivivax sp.]|nr:hypothetical protein [Rubrivivax sp.]
MQLRSHAVGTVLDGCGHGAGPQLQRDPLADLAPRAPLVKLYLEPRQFIAARLRPYGLARRFHRPSPRRIAMETEVIESAASLHADLPAGHTQVLLSTFR